jgi:hypothetical protein
LTSCVPLLYFTYHNTLSLGDLTMFDDYNEYNEFGQDDLEMYNQNEADDYRNEGDDGDWGDEFDGDWDDDDDDDLGDGDGPELDYRGDDGYDVPDYGHDYYG